MVLPSLLVHIGNLKKVFVSKWKILTGFRFAFEHASYRVEKAGFHLHNFDDGVCSN